MAKKLKCVARYRNDARGLIYLVGSEFEIEDALASFLLADAPGCFEEVVEKKAPARRKRVGRPPKDKAVSEPEVEK